VSETAPVRPGEEIELGALNSYLATYAPEVGRVESIEQFSGGFSNLTYLLETDRDAFVLRRPPRGVGKGPAHDVAREYRILSVLATRGVKVPQPVLLCEDDLVIGAPFYLMERVRGVILRRVPSNPPPPAVLRGLSASFVETLVAIHAIDPTDPAVAGLGKPDGYVARQVSGWSRRWEVAQTDDVPSMLRVAGWLASALPPERAPALVHNDFKYDNLVLDPSDLSRVRAVLDWEMATLGDPLLDVGTTLGYWVEAGDHPALLALGLGATALAGNFTRAELWDRYCERSNCGRVDPLYYYVFGLFKIAVIAQQIFFRYRKGLTADPRFARLGEAVRLLGATAERAVARGVISSAAPS